MAFKLERPGETITRLRTQKTVALLAWLALHPHREHGREELIERFWPESDLEQGRASLRVALNALKKALEPPPTPSDSVLIATRTHLKIRPEALTTDVAAFEAALKRKDFTEAQRLYTGPFLPGYYDEWILNEQERLEALLPPSPRPTGELPTQAPPTQRVPGEGGWGVSTSSHQPSAHTHPLLWARGRARAFDHTPYRPDLARRHPHRAGGNRKDASLD